MNLNITISEEETQRICKKIAIDSLKKMFAESIENMLDVNDGTLLTDEEMIDTFIETLEEYKDEDQFCGEITINIEDLYNGFHPDKELQKELDDQLETYIRYNKIRYMR
ncbi:hypothetical protein [Clostridium estertheticum]|uniref:Uncharacterized protein n=1 Tax=Clostridium estertheticum TaxID=238834 RepID=A0AA47I5Y4_9CLOT|nr:hypothetical protein [Clostridium estertheticum]MBU3153490.1 hypothetical protein [Clostridium estertheticum]WAG60892.1 hypothetical protein LL038_01170 [Clostridium estertheticum]